MAWADNVSLLLAARCDGSLLPPPGRQMSREWNPANTGIGATAVYHCDPGERTTNVEVSAFPSLGRGMKDDGLFLPGLVFRGGSFEKEVTCTEVGWRPLQVGECRVPGAFGEHELSTFGTVDQKKCKQTRLCYQ